jgi:putative lipoprotein
MHAFAELIIFGLAPLLFGGLVMPQSVSAEETTISGELSYRERMMLPPGAVLTVQLADMSPAGNAGIVVASETFSTANEMPAGFKMTIDPAKIRSGESYAIQAQISVNGKIWFVNDASTAFQPESSGPLALTLVKSDA